MTVGPCRYCGLPVVVDESPMFAAASKESQMLPKQEFEVFQIAVTSFIEKIARFVCHGACIQKDREEAGIRARKKFRDHMQARYNKAFPFSEPNEMDRIPFAKKEEVLTAFHINMESVMLIGGSGRGKTRLAWLLIHKPFLDGQSVRVISHTKLKTTLQKLSGEGPGKAAELIETLCKVDVLFIDDLGKADMSRHGEGLQIEEATFQILDARIGMKGVRTIMTSNDDGESLKQRMTPDRGEPLVRRIRELTRLFTG